MMMNITILAVGRLKETYFRDAIAEYSKRLTKYCKLEIIEIQDEKAPESLSPAQELIIKDKEGQSIIKLIKDYSYIITLAINGKMLSSEQLSETMSELALSGKSNITFIIGGSLGLSEEVLNKSDMKLSFSKMTFPHQLMRVILLEQIYRSYRISKGEPYHK